MPDCSAELRPARAESSTPDAARRPNVEIGDLCRTSVRYGRWRVSAIHRAVGEAVLETVYAPFGSTTAPIDSVYDVDRPGMPRDYFPDPESVWVRRGDETVWMAKQSAGDAIEIVRRAGGWTPLHIRPRDFLAEFRPFIHGRDA